MSLRIKSPWWSEYRRQFFKRNHLTIEMILRKSFSETLKEYLATCSIGGMSQIRCSKNARIQRLFWIIVFFIAFYAVCAFLRQTWMTTFTSPLVITSESVVYPISKIDFPAVALCNFNRISAKALAAVLKRKISPGHHKNETKYLEAYLKDLGRLIDYRYDKVVQQLVNSMPLLQDLIQDKLNDLMKELAPNCEEMLIKCKWAGQAVNCSNIFQSRRTGLGYCCAFNYALRFNTTDSSTGILTPIKRQTVPGSNNGLTVIADPMIEDYAYPIGTSNGFQVLIHDPRQFPDRASSRVLYRSAQPDYAEFLQVESIKQYATNEVRKYPYKTRKCLFHNELKASFSNMYSYGSCLVLCRIDSIFSMCRCVPFFYPMRTYNNAPFCTLRHLRCLNKHKEKLLHLYPIDTENTTGLEVELADSLYCPDCQPDCELTQHFTRDYRVSLSKITRTGFQNNFLLGVNLTNKCVLHIYRPSPVGVLHRLDIVSYWFEIISNIGGFAGMVMGIGCYTLVEIIYFVIIRLTRRIYINYNKYH